MDKNELLQYRTALSLNLGQLDADYFQHRILFLLSRITSNELVFKGGTAMAKAFGLNRFSEDLDFTAVKKIDLEKILRRIVEELRLLGATAEANIAERKRVSVAGRLRIQGATYDGTELSRLSIRIEVSTREKVLLTPVLSEITPIYQDLQSYTILVMKPEEILAEKVRALLTRNKARDLYDLYFLLNKKTPVNLKLIQKKLSYYKQTFSQSKLEERINALSASWQNELKPLVQTLPSFDQVRDRVQEAFRK